VFQKSDNYCSRYHRAEWAYFLKRKQQYGKKQQYYVQTIKSRKKLQKVKKLQSKLLTPQSALTKNAYCCY